MCAAAGLGNAIGIEAKSPKRRRKAGLAADSPEGLPMCSISYSNPSKPIFNFHVLNPQSL
jgi:hypothetical protein